MAGLRAMAAMRAVRAMGAAAACAALAAWLPGAPAWASARTGAGQPATEQAGTQQRAAQRAAPARFALLIEIDGAIGPATAGYVRKGLQEAAGQGAAVAVLRMDTPGGLASATRDIIRDILASPVPVIAYVAPAGARAASAGTYIAYASHLAAMAPATSIGAATPVQMGGPMAPSPAPAGDGAKPGGSDPVGNNPIGSDPAGRSGPDARPADGAGPAADDPAASGSRASDPSAPGPAPADAASRKAVNDAVSQIRGLAALRGRNADWAERAVRDAASLPAGQARRQGVVEIVADDLAGVLEQAHGRKVGMGKTTVALDTRGLAVREFAPDWRTRLLAAIANPEIAYLLMLLGVYGILFELMNPGAVAPGVVGGIALITALFALNLLPVSYAGLALVGLGIALMTAEAFVASFGILGIGGAIAFALGSLMMFDGTVPGLALSPAVVAAATLASLVLLAVVLASVVRAHRRRAASGESVLLGAAARVLDWQGAGGRVHVHGEDWRAEGPAGLRPGDPVVVVARNGLTLVVQPGQPPPSPQASQPIQAAQPPKPP